jgi:hypothetical protein
MHVLQNITLQNLVVLYIIIPMQLISQRHFTS